jgi:hypothetical protein
VKVFDIYAYNPHWRYEGEIWAWVDALTAPCALSALQYAKSVYGNHAAVEEYV